MRRAAGDLMKNRFCDLRFCFFEVVLIHGIVMERTAIAAQVCSKGTGYRPFAQRGSVNAAANNFADPDIGLWSQYA